MKLKLKKPVAFEFILDELRSIEYRVRAMFGAHAVYSGDKMLFILREKEDYPKDNGVWIATTRDHHESLKKDFPEMRSIYLFESKEPTSWQNLPSESADFEESVMKLCRFILKGDVRIGKVPLKKKKLKRGDGKATSRPQKRKVRKSSPKEYPRRSGGSGKRRKNT